MTNFIIENEEIIGVENETTIRSEYYSIDNINFQALVTLDTNKYFNFYIIDSRLKTEPINLLNHQLDTLPENLKKYLELRVIEHYLWYKYNSEFNIIDESLEF